MSKRLKLEITINNDSGFCFGVVAAINKAEEVIEAEKGIYCLGQLVHNDDEMARLELKGLLTINHKKYESLKGEKILLRAHGEPPSTYITAKKNKNVIIDASCPIILKIQKRIKKAYRKGEMILIFGKHNHPETIGLRGYTNNTAIVFEEVEELSLEDLPSELTLFSQTTMSLVGFRRAIKTLEKAGKKLRVNDTICRQVTNREAALRNYCKGKDIILMVAGKNSSNGELLYATCQECCERAYFISTVEDIKTEWFKAGDKVGITGATSTPLWQMEKVKKYIQSI